MLTLPCKQGGVQMITLIVLVVTVQNSPASQIQQPDIWDAEKYSQHSDQQKMVAQKLLQQYVFNDKDHVLDIGCGDGKITAEIAEKVPNGQVIGVDSSGSMINFANKRFAKANLSFQKGKASSLPYEHQFDCITSFSCLHWEPRQKEALLCFKKALKPGGAILLAIPGPDPVLHSTLETICNSSKWMPYFVGFRSPGHLWAANEYTQLLFETNFIIQKIEVVHRPYAFQQEEQYKLFIAAMLPHISYIPEARRPEFLNDIILAVKGQGHVDEFGRIKFEVKVLEVIAHSPSQ